MFYAPYESTYKRQLKRETKAKQYGNVINQTPSSGFETEVCFFQLCLKYGVTIRDNSLVTFAKPRKRAIR